MTLQAADIQAHSEAEKIWHLNFSDRPAEEFAGLLGVVERELRRERLRAKLPETMQFLRFHGASLRDGWTPLSALSGDTNSGTRCNEYDTLVWLGIAERKSEPALDASGRPAGFRIFFRLVQAPGSEDRTRIEAV